jgi:hypothetical protein
MQAGRRERVMNVRKLAALDMFAAHQFVLAVPMAVAALAVVQARQRR